MTNNLHTEILPEQQKVLFDILSEQSWIAPFYLAGGTALALQSAHRQSVDFDFFTKEDFDNRNIIENLCNWGKFELFNEARNTINALLNDVRISFFKYKYPLLNRHIKYKNISIAGPEDIALMKLEAISGRGSKKDFIDLYFLLCEFSLSELFEKYPLKYGIEISNHYHMLKSLTYFEDAEHEPMPLMLEKVLWEQVKNTIADEVKKVMNNKDL
jgi:hypothetical protein